MAKQIIVLDANVTSQDLALVVAFWYPIATGMKPGASASQWSGALAAENTAIQNGTVIEEVKPFWFPSGTPVAAIKAILQQYYANRVQAMSTTGPHIWYGVFDDSSTGWSA